MLSELCQELKNWFDRGQPKIHGNLEISEGKIINDDFTEVIQNNQYFRIVGSVFNDGVYKYTEELTLIDEIFKGSIWLMAIPKEVIMLNDDIDAWTAKYGGVDSVALSPFSSESFGGYSYTKAQGYASTGGGMLNTWQVTFANRLGKWRKI